MRVKTLVSIGLLLLLLLMLCATPVYANGIPALPHAFHGTVTINGSSAPAGTTVSATGTGVMTNIPQNPVTTTVTGQYGTGGLYLLVQGDILDGATITFYVNGRSTGQTAEWHSGEVTEFNLSVIVAAPGPAPGPTYYYIQTNLFGVVESYRIGYSGELEETIEATSEDGMLTITILKNTITLDEDGNRLGTLEVSIDETPPDPPEDAYIIGLAYDFSPAGATLDPPLTLAYTYDPDALPEDVAEEDLVLAYYDEVNEEWVWVPCEVDTENNIITASVAHFATFAIIAVPVELPSVVVPPTPAAFSVSYLSVSQLEVEPGETVTITVFVANTGGESGSYTVVLKIDGVKEAEETVTIAAGESQDVSFNVTREEAGTYTVAVNGLSGSFAVVAPVVAPAKPGVNWPLTGGIIGGVVVVGLLIFFVLRRRAY